MKLEKKKWTANRSSANYVSHIRRNTHSFIQSLASHAGALALLALSDTTVRGLQDARACGSNRANAAAHRAQCTADAAALAVSTHASTPRNGSGVLGVNHADGGSAANMAKMTCAAGAHSLC